MKKLMGFQLNLDGTPEEQEQMRTEGKACPFTVRVKMPEGGIIRRVNTRILQKEVSGVHPQTKQIGRFIMPEEVVWMYVEGYDTSPLVERAFVVIPTDGEVPCYDRAPNSIMSRTDLPYVGTFFLQAGMLVFHMYGPR